MGEDAKSGAEARTLVCSVLFLDLAGYSMLGVAEQIKLKQRFNEILAGSLADMEARDRVVIDTGDGAAIAFLDDPERALFAAIAIFDNVGELPVRMGINLGPVYVSKDINGQDNVIGDGINVAQRVMSFAQKGELLVSRSFYEVVLLLSGDYAAMFQARGAQSDKRPKATWKPRMYLAYTQKSWRSRGRAGSSWAWTTGVHPRCPGPTEAGRT